MKFETFEEWKKIFDIHQRFGKHNWNIAADKISYMNTRTCLSCGYSEKFIGWHYVSNGTHYPKMVPAMPAYFNGLPYENLAYAIDHVLNGCLGTEVSTNLEPRVIANHPDKVALKSMRACLLKLSPDVAWAYAKEVGDYSNDIKEKIYQSPELVIEWLEKFPKDADDSSRIGACKKPGLALRYSRMIDKGPHKLTCSSAARSSETSLLYAELWEKQLTKKQMLQLERGAASTSTGLRKWADTRGVNNVLRKAATKRYYSSWVMATELDKERGGWKGYRDKLHSSYYYGLNYNLSVEKRPSVLFEKRNNMRPEEWPEYCLTYGRWTNTIDTRVSNRYIGQDWMAVLNACKEVSRRGKKITERELLKSAYRSAAYLCFVKGIDADLKDKLRARANRNRVCRWMLSAAEKNRKRMGRAGI